MSMHNGNADEKSFSGQVVCVAGASRGIGEAISQAFAQKGARLLLLSRSGIEAELDTDVMSLRCDVGSYDDVSRAMSLCMEKWGRLDVLVNTAAVLGPVGEMWNSDPAEWAGTITANLLGTYHTMRAALPIMTPAGRGKIINFAGGGAAYAYPKFTAYAASKVAVVRLTETVAAEAAPFNVQVNVIAPGAIDTDMLKAVRRAGGEVRTVGTMDQPVALVLFLASRESDHISGRFIHAKDDYRTWTPALAPDSYTLRRVSS